MKVQNVNRIIVHHWPDLDALMAVALILRFCPEKFPGISRRIPVTFVPAGKLPKDFIHQPGDLILDTGFGRWDHHQRNDRKCTFDLIVEAAGMAKLPWLQSVLDFVQRQDLEGENISVKNSEEFLLLTSLIRGVHLLGQRAKMSPVACFWNLVEVCEAVLITASEFPRFSKELPEQQSLTPNLAHGLNEPWVFRVQNAFMQYLWQEYGSPDESCHETLKEVIRRLDELNPADDDPEWKLSRDLCQMELFYQMVVGGGKFSGTSAAALFTIYGVAYGLCRLGHVPEVTLNQLAYLFKGLSLVESDKNWAAYDWADPDLCRLVRFTSKKEGDGSKTITFCTIVSDCKSTPRAARHAYGNVHHKAQVIICQRPKANQVQIFAPKHVWWQYRLHRLAIALRMAELISRGEPFTMKEIEMLGVCDKCPEWYSGVIISNGTLTNPDVPRTKLNLAQIMRLAQNVFYFGQVPPRPVIERILELGREEEMFPEGDEPYPDFWVDVRIKQAAPQAKGLVAPLIKQEQ